MLETKSPLKNSEGIFSDSLILKSDLNCLKSSSSNSKFERFEIKADFECFQVGKALISNMLRNEFGVFPKFKLEY